MAGNTRGKLFTLTTFGESHGPAYGCIVDGCPPGLALTPADLQRELDRRRPGTSSYVSQRREPDHIKILSGVFKGKTTGTPIGLLVENVDTHATDYEKLRDVFRPGHADLAYQQKYGIRDYYGGGRASARETVMRVAAGAIAKKYLQEYCAIHIYGYLAQMGPLTMDEIDLSIIEENPFFCPDKSKISLLEKLIQQLRVEKDSIGARINVIATGMKAGLGEPVFDRLDADIAHALIGIPAVKGIEIGAGFRCITQYGSRHRDAITPTGSTSNHAGGVLGGLSTGQDLLVSIAFKPTSSIPQPIQTINLAGEATEVVVTGRHDPCVGIRAVPIVEAMLALVLMDHVLRDRAQNGK